MQKEITNYSMELDGQIETEHDDKLLLTINGSGVQLKILKKWNIFSEPVSSQDIQIILKGNLAFDYNKKRKIELDQENTILTEIDLNLHGKEIPLLSLPVSINIYQENQTELNRLEQFFIGKVLEQIKMGDVTELIGREGLNWDEEEEQAMKQIYLACVVDDKLLADQIKLFAKYFSNESDTVSLSDDEQSLVEKIENSGPENGFKKLRQRGAGSLKMKAYQFAPTGGFENVSKNAERIKQDL